MPGVQEVHDVLGDSVSHEVLDKVVQLMQQSLDDKQAVIDALTDEKQRALDQRRVINQRYIQRTKESTGTSYTPSKQKYYLANKAELNRKRAELARAKSAQLKNARPVPADIF